MQGGHGEGEVPDGHSERAKRVLEQQPYVLAEAEKDH